MSRMLAGALAALFGIFIAVQAVAGEKQATSYKLLRLDGNLVKWGKPKLGVGSVVTYAVAGRRMAFAKAINCKAIAAPDGFLSRQKIAPEIFRRELAAAFRTWEAVAHISFREVSDAATAGIIIGAQVNPRGRAYTNVAYDGDEQAEPVRTIERALICFNPRHPWKVGFDGDVDTYDLRYALIHEIGHAIGLDHSGPEGQIMGFRYTEAYRVPQPGDISGVAALYGAARTQLGAAGAAGKATDEKSVQPLAVFLARGRREAAPELSLGEPPHAGSALRKGPAATAR